MTKTWQRQIEDKKMTMWGHYEWWEMRFRWDLPSLLLSWWVSLPVTWETAVPWWGGNRLFGASLVAQMVKSPRAMQETWLRYLDWEDPLEEGMAPHSSILARRIPWTEESGWLPSMKSQSQTPLSTDASSATWRETGAPVLVGCGAWHDGTWKPSGSLHGSCLRKDCRVVLWGFYGVLITQTWLTKSLANGDWFDLSKEDPAQPINKSIFKK